MRSDSIASNCAAPENDETLCDPEELTETLTELEMGRIDPEALADEELEVVSATTALELLAEDFPRGGVLACFAFWKLAFTTSVGLGFMLRLLLIETMSD